MNDKEQTISNLRKLKSFHNGSYGADIDRAIKALEQEPKTGHWIKVTNGRGGHECDVCHDYAPGFKSGDEYLSTFCPNCGAKMVKPQESEVQDAVSN